MARGRRRPTISFADAVGAFGDDGRRGDRRPDHPDGAPERWLVPATALLALLLTGVLLWRAEHAALHDPVKQGERGEISGLDHRSLLTERKLRAALTQIGARMDADEVVTDLELSAVGARVLVRDGEAHQRSLRVGLDGRLRSADAGTSTSDGPRLAAIDAAVPARLITRALRSGGYSGRRVADVDWDYEAATETQRWTLHLKDVPIADQIWFADASGEHIRRSGDPEPPSPTAGQVPIDPTAPVAPPPPPPPPPPAAPRPTRTRPATVRVPEGSGVSVVRVGGTTILTDPAAGRRLNRCLKRAGRSARRAQACVDQLGRSGR